MLARTEKITFQGDAGAIDCALDLPMDPPLGWALVLHPHPLHGGARNNKIVTTIARACVERGLMALRPDFRGVGSSEGEFDAAKGETTDMQQLVAQFAQQYPEAAAGKFVLAGFSFGTSVAAQLYSALKAESQKLPDALMLVGSAVDRFKFRDIDVPDHTFLVHGEVDEVVPLSEAMDFARSRELPMVVIPDASHFFHGKLVTLKALVQQRLASI
ncbi:alpha/beta hydrolase [Pollutimonas thiosulfatoxidans]|uniref:Alpha/beta hydrolase n=1 Tax=Pollutimonas thiosulfatoxidans TaxID=2028345 RepID=A0A410GE29_9BURK|nr:alpha/beta hydrolase [Pollutimonas thiosulfatoxidans]QAA94552.1 alpha/beta hydrolase [Pollutimonas thiosulfatoxidans]